MIADIRHLGYSFGRKIVKIVANGAFYLLDVLLLLDRCWPDQSSAS